MKKMYVVVNEDLKQYDVGLISAQCCHAVFDHMDKHIKKCLDCMTYGHSDHVVRALFILSDFIDIFRLDGNGMVVLEASENKLKEFQDKGYTTVIDRTMNNKITAVNLGIFDDTEKPEFIKKLKLLRR